MILRRRIAAAGSFLLALLALLVLLKLDRGALAGPPLAQPHHLQAWAQDRDASVMAFAVLRLLTMVAAAYLVATTLLGVAAELSGIPSLVRAAEAASLPLVRRIVAALVGVGLTASIASASLLNQPPVSARVEVVLAGPANNVPTGTSESAFSRASEPELVLSRLPDDEGSATMEVIAEQENPAQLAVWTTSPGDNFWHIAEHTLSEAWKRSPSDQEVAHYWHQLIDENRPKLVEPGNPDLIYPGQAFALPPVPTAP